jgi:stage II sporulation protein D
VAALRDESQARQLGGRLGSALGVDADVVFDAGSGLHKVRVGSYPDRPAAEGGKRRLLELGVPGAFTVHEDRGLEAAGLVLELGGERRAPLATRAVELTASSGVVRYAGKPYRGRLRIFLNQRGLLNVINELDLESYLRGVVPMELGPELYPELDALRAQAVAARTYTMRNLGRFEDDGYDICATPRCQVYGGVAVEHPLSDRAIAETAGEVALFEGGAIDALYSSTCGGRTESVSWVFPDKHEPYLASVPCAEGGSRRFGSAAQRDALASWLLEVSLGRIAGDGRSQLEERIRRLAQLVAVPRPGERLASLERSEVWRFVASQLDLALDARLLLAAGGDPPPRGWSSRDRRLLGLLEARGESAPSAALLDGAEAEQLVLELVRYFGGFQLVEGSFQELGEGEIEIAGGALVSRLPLAAAVGAWRRRPPPTPPGRAEAGRLEPGLLRAGSLEPEEGGRPVAGVLELVPGDPLELYLVRGAVVAVVQHADTVGPTAAMRTDRQRWTRFRSTARVAGLVRQRFPGFELADLVVLERGASGRVASLELVARDGRREVLAGLPIRWTLDVPDTWFELTRTRSRAGDDGWLVEGRGWGHGVGMCQVGAFAMARRGHDYREILEHYYRGVEVRQLSASSPRTVAGP